MLSFIDPNVYTDLEFFLSFSDNTNTIINSFDPYLITKSSKHHLIHCLKHPIYDIPTLKSRQQRLHSFIHIYNNNKQLIDEYLDIIKNTEDDLNWVMSKKFDECEDVVDVMKSVYFSLYPAQFLNNISLILTIKNVYTILIAPLLGILSPLMYIIVPYFIIVYKLKFKIPIKSFVSFFLKSLITNHNLRKIFCFQLLTLGLSLFLYCNTILNMIDLSSSTYMVCQTIYRRVSSVLEYLKRCNELVKLFGLELNEEYYKLIKFVNTLDSNLNILNFGEKLVLYKNLLNYSIKGFRSYVDESLLSLIPVVKLIRNQTSCFVNYIVKDAFYINATDLYHLSLSSSVRNNIVLDQQNALITGPNAAGKSTIIKSLLVNVILGQTYGIACCSQFDFTPFYYITSQIHVPDVKGKMSLFEAEMFRCKQTIDIVDELPKKRKSLVVMDEVFSSTNIVEGVSGAFGILNYLSNFENVCVVATTHYFYLTKLPKFIKFKMEANVNEDNEVISYNYKLNNGTSKQFIAIELLKKQFNKDIITTALNTKQKLLV